MKKGITYINFVENKVRIGTNLKTSWKGKLQYNLTDTQLHKLRKFILSNDLEDLAHFLNVPEKSKDGVLIVIELLWAFSKNNSINVVADDSYAKKLSTKGVKSINKMLEKRRQKLTGEKG